MGETPTVVSIKDWLIQRGHHPDEVVNGESLHDLLWAFWVFNDDERRRNWRGGAQ